MRSFINPSVLLLAAALFRVTLADKSIVNAKLEEDAAFWSRALSVSLSGNEAFFSSTSDVQLYNCAACGNQCATNADCVDINEKETRTCYCNHNNNNNNDNDQHNNGNDENNNDDDNCGPCNTCYYGYCGGQQNNN